MLNKRQTASFTSFQIPSSAGTTLDDSMEIYDGTAGSGDDGEKVQLLRKLDNRSKNTKGYGGNGYDEEMGRKFKVVGGSDDNADFSTSS